MLYPGSLMAMLFFRVVLTVCCGARLLGRLAVKRFHLGFRATGLGQFRFQPLLLLVKAEEKADLALQQLRIDGLEQIVYGTTAITLLHKACFFRDGQSQK